MSNVVLRPHVRIWEGLLAHNLRNQAVSDILAKIRSKKKPVEAATPGVKTSLQPQSCRNTSRKSHDCRTPLTEAAVAESTTVTSGCAETPKTDKAPKTQSKT